MIGLRQQFIRAHARCDIIGPAHDHQLIEIKPPLEEFCKRLGSFTLTDTNDFAYHPSFMLRGLVKLDLDIVASTVAA